MGGSCKFKIHAGMPLLHLPSCKVLKCLCFTNLMDVWNNVLKNILLSYLFYLWPKNDKVNIDVIAGFFVAGFLGWEQTCKLFLVTWWFGLSNCPRTCWNFLWLTVEIIFRTLRYFVRLLLGDLKIFKVEKISLNNDCKSRKKDFFP